jgi:hypothetical protein
MNSLKPGSIGFVMHHDNFFSRIIARCMSSRWSHSFMVCESTPNRVFLVECSNYESTYGTIGKYLMSPTCEMEVWEPTDPQAPCEAAVAAAESHVETFYGYLQLFSLGFRRLMMRLHWKTRNLIRLGLVCDQLVLEGAIQYPALSKLDPKGIDTQELYEAVTQSGAFRLVFFKASGVAETAAK